MNLDHEIAFPAPKKFEPLPSRAIVYAAGFNRLGAYAPAGVRSKTNMIGSLISMAIWDDWLTVGPVLGAPMAVMAMEDMIRRGVEEFIFVGLAGSLSPDLKIGSLFCPDSGVSTEGTSGHYPAPMEPDAELRERIISSAPANVEVAGGRIWSTDGIYRETVGLVQQQRALGAVGVDMEITAIWAASMFRGVKAVALTVISDFLDGTEHFPGFHLPEFREGMNLAARTAWRAVGVSV